MLSTPILVAIGATLGVIVGALITRRWHLPTAEKLAHSVKVLGGTASVTILVALAGFLGVLFVVAFGAVASVVHEMYTRRPLDPSSFWANVLDSILILIGAMSGVGVVGKIGHRVSAKPEVIREEAAAEAKKVVAEAQADVVRQSGAFPVVTAPDAEGRSGPAVEPARNLDDDGVAL